VKQHLGLYKPEPVGDERQELWLSRLRADQDRQIASCGITSAHIRRIITQEPPCDEQGC
jgi:hypothetical protein